MAGVFNSFFDKIYRYEMKQDTTAKQKPKVDSIHRKATRVESKRTEGTKIDSDKVDRIGEASKANQMPTDSMNQENNMHTTDDIVAVDGSNTKDTGTERMKRERTSEQVDKEDFLLRQIDEFREKAKQLQVLLASKENKVAELQTILNEREVKAEQLEGLVNERKEAAEVLLNGVQSQMDVMISQVEDKLNILAEKIESNVNDTTGRTAAQTEEMKAALDDVSKQLDQMKLELAEKIHTEDVKCYRNMATLIEELTSKIEANDATEKSMDSLKGYIKCLSWFSILNFIVLVAFILYNLGIFHFV